MFTNKPGGPAGDEQDSGHRQLLTIVARGTAIITEIYRLVELIPEPFLQRQYPLGLSRQTTPGSSGSNKRGDSGKPLTLDEIVFDFSYFGDAERIEAQIERDACLKRADEMFCDQYSDLLTRFFLTFESIHRYASDLNRFAADLEDDVYLGQTLETLLLEVESRQLICEAYFQLGYMLLLVDLNFDGALRERLIVSYYRYSSYKSSPSTGLDGTCNLLRTSHFKCDTQRTYKGAPSTHFRPPNYPEEFFARANVSETLVNALIAKLQLVDVYNKTLAVYPQPEHRSTALAQQAALLYVLLYFCPSILKTQRSRMRELTDKFFSDSWVLDLFMGERVNLIEAWEPYKAARESLLQILDVESVRNLTAQINAKFDQMERQINEQFLLEGWLTEQTLLDNNARILNCIRNSNVCLRWILLHLSMRAGWHAFKLAKLLQTIVVATMPSLRRLCEFLQQLAVLEKRAGGLFEAAIRAKAARIEEHKQRACETLAELVAIFDDSKPQRWVRPGANANLANILARASEELASLSGGDDCSLQVAPRDQLIKLINRIEAARESYSDDRSLQVVQLFAETRESLLKLLRNLDLDSANLRMVLQSLGDFSYAWRLMDEFFTQHLQQTIKDNPFSMFGLEAIVLKLSAAFETQLLRLQQVGAQADLVSVSQYYSTKLVAYVRHVLQVIPATILELIGAIIELQTNNILGPAMPAKIPLDHLRSYALPEQRFRLLELTSRISNYAKGLMSMPSTTIGLVRLNSRQLLEEGMRLELARRMSQAIQGALDFRREQEGAGGQAAAPASSCGQLVQASCNLRARLEQLAATLDGYKRSFEYVQDYLFIYGLRMWQEELARIIRANYEQATAALLEQSASLASRQNSDANSVSSRGVATSARSQFSTSATTTATVRNQAALGPAGSQQASSRQASPREGLQASFIVRLISELLRVTNPRATIYDEQTNAWFEQRGVKHQQVLDAKLFQLARASLGVAGVNALDKFCSTLIMLELQRLASLINESTSMTSAGAQARESPTAQAAGAGLLEALRAVSGALRQRGQAAPSLAPKRRQVQKALATGLAKLAPICERLTNHLLSIGQLQALRVNFAAVLSTSCRYEARHLYACLSALNATTLASLKHAHKPRKEPAASGGGAGDALNESAASSAPPPPPSLEDSQLVFELTNHLEWIGLSDPLNKIYTLAAHNQLQQREPEAEQAPVVALMFLLLVELSGKFNFSRPLNGFLPKQARGYFYEPAAAAVDALPLFYGLVTLLRHCQPTVELGGAGAQAARPLDQLLALMGAHVDCALGWQGEGATAAAAAGGHSLRPHDLSLDIVNMLLSINELARLSGASTKAARLPAYLLDAFQFVACRQHVVAP